MPFFTAYDNKIVDHVNGVASLTAEAHYHLALSTTTPAKGGTNITEPAGNNYARVQVTNSNATWNAAASAVGDNKVAIPFPQATGSWGTITYVVAFAADNTTPVWYAALTASKAIANGDIFNFAIGDLDQTAD